MSTDANVVRQNMKTQFMKAWGEFTKLTSDGQVIHPAVVKEARRADSRMTFEVPDFWSTGSDFYEWLKKTTKSTEEDVPKCVTALSCFVSYLGGHTTSQMNTNNWTNVYNNDSHSKFREMWVNALVAMVQYIQVFKVGDPMFLQDEKWQSIEKKVNEARMNVMSSTEKAQNTILTGNANTLIQMRVFLEAL